MRPEVEFTPQVTALLLRRRAEHSHLVLLLDDTSCCSNSNVIAREGQPSWPVALLSEKDGIRVFLNPVLEKSLKAKRIVLDVMDFADDSFSLETDYGKRLIMSVG